MNQNLTGRHVFFRTLRIMIFRNRSYLQAHIIRMLPPKNNAYFTHTHTVPLGQTIKTSL